MPTQNKSFDLFSLFTKILIVCMHALPGFLFLVVPFVRIVTLLIEHFTKIESGNAKRGTHMLIVYAAVKLVSDIVSAITALRALLKNYKINIYA